MMISIKPSPIKFTWLENIWQRRKWRKVTTIKDWERKRKREISNNQTVTETHRIHLHLLIACTTTITTVCHSFIINKGKGEWKCWLTQENWTTLCLILLLHFSTTTRFFAITPWNLSSSTKIHITSLSCILKKEL